MNVFRLILIFIVNIIISGCSGQQKQYAITSTAGYNYNKPDEIIQLPDTLREVSGITWIENSIIACIQDENGIVFYYDLRKKELSRQELFGENGDYEGIANDGSDIWILRSDGNLFCYQGKNKFAKIIKTGIPSENNEGLCFDKTNHRLLIAAKGKLTGGKELKGKRMIFSYDLTTRRMDSKPVKIFDLDKIRNAAVEMNVVKKWRTRKKSGEQVPDIEFHTSAIAKHPVTGQFYILSDKDNLLFIFEKDFSLRTIINLDPVLFNKAEGITFLPDGEMLISNEGQEKKPTLLRFTPGK